MQNMLILYQQAIMGISKTANVCQFLKPLFGNIILNMHHRNVKQDLFSIMENPCEPFNYNGALKLYCQINVLAAILL